VTDTTWGNNTALDSNIIQFAPGGGSSGISNIGTWNDTNAFSTQIRSDHIYPSTFHNIGTYNKQGNGLTIIEANYNNTGTTNVSAGSLGLSGGGSSTGVFNITANSKLESLGGTHYLNDAATSGAGTLHIRGNSIVNVNGGKHSTPLAISQDGQLQGANTFDGPVTWTGGSIKGGGLTVFAESLSITGDMEKKIDGGHILLPPIVPGHGSMFPPRTTTGGFNPARPGRRRRSDPLHIHHPASTAALQKNKWPRK